MFVWIMSRSICLQVSLLILYLLLIFILSRLHDLVIWFHHGFSSTEVVDPILLSVRQLKHLLEVRGVSYTGCVEKHELASLVEESADVTQGEIADTSIEIANRGSERLSDYAAKTPSYFTGGPHFYEEVEDTKDSVWLVQVVPSQGSKTGIGIGSQQSADPLLDDYSWRVVCNQLAPFAIRTGIFDCRLDRRLCLNKGWHRPLLLLALPRGWRAKDKVVMRTSTLTRPQAIVEWVREQLAVRLNSVRDVMEAEQEWIRKPHEEVSDLDVRIKGHNFTEDDREIPKGNNDSSSESAGGLWGSKGEEVRVLLVTHLLHPPLFLAALSIKFTGRVRFGVLAVRREEKELVKKRLGLNRVPAYLVSTPERTVVYGSHPREHFNVGSMNAFLRAINPETNDAFLLSLALTNALVFIQAFQVSGGLWRHAASCVWVLVTHNLWLFSIWLVVLGTGHFPLPSLLISRLRAPARWVAMSELGSLLRSDWIALLDHPIFLFGSLAVYASLATAVLRWIKMRQLIDSSELQTGTESEGIAGSPPSGSSAEERAWWEVFPMDSYLLDCFFRPVTSSSSSVSSPSLGSGDLELEEGIEMLIERLEMPDLWLRPAVPMDYLKNLPIWRHRWTAPCDVNPHLNKNPYHTAPREEEDDHAQILEMMDADDRGGRVSGGSWCRRRTGIAQREECFLQTGVNRSSTEDLDVGGDASQLGCSCRYISGDSDSPSFRMCDSCVAGISSSSSALHPALSSSSEGEESGAEVGCGMGPPPGILYTYECAVCLEAYGRGVVLCGLPCGHNYHRGCIMTWLSRDNHHCPVCRWPAYRSRPVVSSNSSQMRSE